MNTFISKHYALKVLLYAWLSCSFIGVSSDLSEQAQENKISAQENFRRYNNFSWKNTRVNLNFSLCGFPEGLIYFPTFKIGKNDKKVSIDKRSRLDLSLEMLAVYNFIITPRAKKQFSLEAGIAYNFPEPIEIREFNIVFIEDYISIPICFKICYKISSYFTFSGLLAYEFNLTLNSQYNQSGYYAELPTSMCGNKNIRNLLPNVPQWWSAITCGIRFEFPKGIYIDFIKSRIPIGLTKYKWNYYYEHNNLVLDRSFVDLMRLMNAKTIRIDIGVNLMKWYFPDNVYY